MNAGIIVGYITRLNGSPISGAEIRISETGGKPDAKTDSRGYFQLAFDGGADIAEFGGSLSVLIGDRKDVRINSKGSKTSENRFQITGYLIKETLSSDA